MKIRPVGAAVFHEDRRTEEWAYMTKLTAFRNFSKTLGIIEQPISPSSDNI